MTNVPPGGTVPEDGPASVFDPPALPSGQGPEGTWTFSSSTNYDWIYGWLLAFAVTLLQMPAPHTDDQLAEVANDTIAAMKISEQNGYAKPPVR